MLTVPIHMNPVLVISSLKIQVFCRLRENYNLSRLLSASCWQKKVGNHHFGFPFLSLCLYTHSRPWPQGIWVFLFGHSEVTNLLGLIIRTVVWLRLLTGVKEQRLPSLPHHHPSLSLHLPDSQQVLLFSSHHCLLRDESLAALNRHTCVTPGCKALPLISFLNWRPVSRSSSWKVHQKASGTMYWVCT